MSEAKEWAAKHHALDEVDRLRSQLAAKDAEIERLTNEAARHYDEWEKVAEDAKARAEKAEREVERLRSQIDTWSRSEVEARVDRLAAALREIVGIESERSPAKRTETERIAAAALAQIEGKK